jgi:hypothetical protein
MKTEEMKKHVLNKLKLRIRDGKDATLVARNFTIMNGIIKRRKEVVS